MTGMFEVCNDYISPRNVYTVCKQAAALALSSITIDICCQAVPLLCDTPPGYFWIQQHVGSTRMCTTISYHSVSCACSTQQLTWTVGFTFIVMPALPLEVTLCLQLPSQQVEQVLKHSLSLLKVSIRLAKVVKSSGCGLAKHILLTDMFGYPVWTSNFLLY